MRDRPPVHLVAAFGEFVVEVEPPQVLRVHAVGQARRSAFQAIMSVIGVRSPRRYSRIMRDQTRSLERRSWNAPAICSASRKPCSHIMSSRNRNWLSLMKSCNSPGSVKSTLRGEEGQAWRSRRGAVARHGRGGDRQECTAQAVSRTMDLGIGHDGGNSVEGRHNAETAVVVERGVAHRSGSGLLPRDRKDRVAAVDEILDQRVPRRQVENVVFHDPGRHDEYRLGLDLPVDGTYWMSSTSSLRSTTLPGVMATSQPGAYASAPTGGRPP